MSEIQGIAPPDTQPDKAIPVPDISSTLPDSTTAEDIKAKARGIKAKAENIKDVPPITTIREKSPQYLQRLDATISHLNRVLSTPQGTDTFLQTINYTSLAASQLLTTISLRALNARLNRLRNALTKLPPNTTILIEGEIPSSRLLRISKQLRALSTLISDFRIFVRLWGLLGIWSWAKSLLQDPPKDIVQRRIAWAQVLVNLGYQYLENGAYLSSKGVMSWTTKKQNSAWLWSSRFWAMHVVLDLGRLGYELNGQRKDGEHVDVKAVKETWVRQTTTNLAYLPLTLHWSVDGGLLHDFAVGVFGSVAGLTKLRDLWRRTAE